MIRLAYASPSGEPVIVDLDTTQPRVSLLRAPEPEPTPDPWALVPDGTLIAGVGRILFGAHPSRQGDVICLHKNVNEQEYRRVLGDGRILHWFDASRQVGDTGWYLEPEAACEWARESFYSGDGVICRGERVEYPSGARVPWVHTIRLYGTVGGGVIVDFDPRFPQDFGPKKMREIHGNLPDGRLLFEEWYTPVGSTAVEKAERSKDVRLRRIEGHTDPNAPARPFIPCPRPLAPPSPPPVPDPQPDPMPYVAPPRDQLLAVLTWLREEVYPGLVGHPLDDEGIAAWVCDRYCTLRAQGVDHEAARHRVFAEIEAVVRPKPPVVPPPAGLAPVLTTRGRLLTHPDGTIADVREVSAFMLLARLLRGEDIRPILRGWRDRRMTHVRVLGMVGTDFWRRRGWRVVPGDVGYDDALERLCWLTGDEGMGLRLTLFADAQVCCPTLAERAAFARRVGRIVARFPHVVVEIANEPSINGFAEGDPSALATLAAQITREAPDRLVALGAEHGARGHLGTYDVTPAGYVTFHAERRTGESGWAWIRRLSEYGVVLSGTRPVWSGEPINAGSEGAPGDFQTDPAIWFAYGALSRIVPSHGYVPCLHLDRGLWAELPADEATEACVRAFHAGCDAVPLACKTGTWVNGHWEASPFRGFSQTDPPRDDRPSRMFGRIVDGVYYGVAIRAPHGWRHGDVRFPVTLHAVAPRGERFGCQVWRSA